MAARQTPALTEDTADKYVRVLELRRAGLTFDQIAVEVGYAGRQGAKEAYDAAIRRLGNEPAADMQVLENERLDDLWRRAYARLRTADTVDEFVKLEALMLRISTRRAGLLGLDAPRQVEISGRGGGAIQTDIGEILRKRVAAIDAAAP
jgi:hypothetical protein